MTPNPAWLVDDFRAFERTLALRAAVEMDLFTLVGAGLDTVQALAANSGSSPRGLRSLCDYLSVQGHLLKHRGRYSLSLQSRMYLTTDSPVYIGSAVKFLASDATVAAFCRLRQAVRRGAASTRNVVGRTSSGWVEFARSMAPLARPVAEFAASALKADSAGPIRVLDIAAGHGLYGLAIARRNPAAEIFALDSPQVLKVAVQNARQAGAIKRYHPIPGDALKVKFGGPYDLILAANFAHHFDQAANIRVFRKCRAALKPAGRLVLIDFVPNADRVSPAVDAAFALTLFATTARGEVYTFKEYSHMLRAAGFGRVRHLNTGDFPRWIVTASR